MADWTESKYLRPGGSFTIPKTDLFILFLFTITSANTTLSNTSTIRDVRPNQNTTVAGHTNGFGGANMFESVVDKTKTIIPNHGPNRRSATKIRIENNFISGSGAGLSRTRRWDRSANDHSPTDSSKLGIYFSPVDAVNEDIVLSFANLDFNKYLGDPRDNFRLEYRDLKDSSNKEEIFNVE